MISKELLSSVVQKDLLRIQYLNEKTVIYFWKDILWFEKRSRFTIYELIQKCKIWAWKQGYEIIAGVDVVNVLSSGTTIFTTEPSDIEFDPIDVITACQWIYDNKVKG